MDITVVSELINSVGFPIAVCIALFWNNRETQKHYRTLLNEYRVTIDRNTTALNELSRELNK